MELSNFNVENSTELSVVNEINIDESIFTDMIDTISNAMNRLGIKLDGKSIYYQRNANKTSILAVKLCNGDDNDTNNYMINGCDATYFNGHGSCDVYLHANKKVGQAAMNMANMVSSDIVSFFDTIEGELALNGLTESELFIRIPLGIKEEQVKDNKENRVLRFVRKIFNNK